MPLNILWNKCTNSSVFDCLKPEDSYTKRGGEAFFFRLSGETKFEYFMFLRIFDRISKYSADVLGVGGGVLDDKWRGFGRMHGLDRSTEASWILFIKTL